MFTIGFAEIFILNERPARKPPCTGLPAVT
jgi:hypothetical protein